jgi:dimeric dUTPase (all-alpha-NTP-PPase superfamily)
MEVADKLKKIFEMQLLLQDLTHKDLSGKFKGNIQYMRLMALGAQEEISEIMRACGWKPWKKSSEFDFEQAKKEYVDLWHFVVNMAFGMGISSDELFEMYYEKNKINTKRQLDGY